MVRKYLQFEKISIGTLLVLITHTIVGVWYASNIVTRVSSMEQQISEVKSDVRDIRNHIMEKSSKTVVNQEIMNHASF